MIEKEKMLAGKIYDGQDEELLSLRFKAHKLSKMYNDTFEEETEKRKQIIDELFPNKKGDLWLQGPIQIDYGEYHFNNS